MIGYNNKKEAFSRVVIDAQLKDVGWDLTDGQSVRYEYQLPDGTFADYVLSDRHGRAVVEAKRAATNLQEAVEQGRAYAEQLDDAPVLSGCRRQDVGNQNEDPGRRSPGTGHCTPGTECPGAKGTIIYCSQHMPPKPKQIVELAMNAQESLRMSIGTQAAHLTFLLSGRLV